MKDTVKATLLTTAMISAPVLGLAAANTGDTLGVAEADIRAALEAQGYVIQEFEIEDDELEVEASLNGILYEIEISPQTGEILEIEEDDD